MHPITRHHGTAARPRGPTGTPRASLRQTHGGRSANARVPPVDSVDDPLRRRRTTVWIKLPGVSSSCRQGVNSGCRLTLAPCSRPSRTLRAAFGDGLRPSLTATVRDALHQCRPGRRNGLRPNTETVDPETVNSGQGWPTAFPATGWVSRLAKFLRLPLLHRVF